MKSRFERLLAAVLLAIGVAHAIPAGAQAAPGLVGTVSRKVHGAAGTFDLPLALTPENPTTEPRSGPGQTVVFIFDKPVTGGMASVVEGAAAAEVPVFSGVEMIVPLTGVTDDQFVTVTVTGVTAADGGTGGTGLVRIGYLAGDITQNRVVTLSDLGQVNAQIAQFVTGANFLKDVNASGTLSLADKGLANAAVTRALTAPIPALPPDPGPAGMATLLGVDTDNDGVRDDIQRYIALTYPYSTKTRAALTGIAKANQQRLALGAAPDAAVVLLAADRFSRAFECLSYVTGGKGGETNDRLLARTLNTAERSHAYFGYNDLLAGKVLAVQPPHLWKSSCDGFNPDLQGD